MEQTSEERRAYRDAQVVKGLAQSKPKARPKKKTAVKAK